MVKNKKIIGFSILFIIFLFSGGVLYWKNQQKIIETEGASIVDNNSSEKTPGKIPEEIEVTEEAEGYKITNNADNYSFMLPEDWEKIESADYYSKQVYIEDRVASVLRLIGEATDQEIIITKFENNLLDINIRDWTDKLYSDFNLTEDLNDYKIGDMEVVIISRKDEISMDSFFFKKESNIYSITCTNKETIENIIVNGEW